MAQAVSTRKLALFHAQSAAAIAPTTPLKIVDAAINHDNGADDAGDLVAALGANAEANLDPACPLYHQQQRHDHLNVAIGYPVPVSELTEL